MVAPSIVIPVLSVTLTAFPAVSFIVVEPKTVKSPVINTAPESFFANPISNDPTVEVVVSAEVSDASVIVTPAVL